MYDHIGFGFSDKPKKSFILDVENDAVAIAFDNLSLPRLRYIFNLLKWNSQKKDFTYSIFELADYSLMLFKELQLNDIILIGRDLR